MQPTLICIITWHLLKYIKIFKALSTNMKSYFPNRKTDRFIYKYCTIFISVVSCFKSDKRLNPRSLFVWTLHDYRVISSIFELVNTIHWYFRFGIVICWIYMSRLKYGFTNQRIWVSNVIYYEWYYMNANWLQLFLLYH